MPNYIPHAASLEMYHTAGLTRLNEPGMPFYFKMGLIALTAALALSQLASAIGVSPAAIEFNNTVRGGYAEKVMTLSTAGGEELTVRVESAGAIKDWIKFEPNQSEIGIPKRSARPVTVKFYIPSNVQNGYYEGTVVITTLYRGVEPEGNVSLARFMPGLIVKVRIRVTGDEVSAYRMKSVSAKDAERDYPVEFTVTVENTGNVVVTPRLQFVVLDDERNPLGKYFEYAESQVLPTITKDISIKMPTEGMGLGDYYAQVTSDSGESYTVFFQVLSAGTLSVRGSLEQIMLNKIWVKPDETVKLEGTFINEGERDILSAKLKCEVNLMDQKEGTMKLVKVLDGLAAEVPVGVRTILDAYFTPQDGGRYSIDCRVFYSGRTTGVKSTVLNVREPESAYYNIITLISSQKAAGASILAFAAVLALYLYSRRRT